jgi:hypothetical protein
VGSSLVRARTPHTPRGRALKRRPGVRSCARSSERSSEGGRHGSFPAKSAAEARGNSHESTQSLLRCPVRFLGGRQARLVGPWANGRRRGVPAYASVAPLAPGGVSGRLGDNGRGVVLRSRRVARLDPMDATDLSAAGGPPGGGQVTWRLT